MRIRHLFLVLSLIINTTAFAAVKLKLGLIAPEGTSWSNNIKSMGKEIEKETNGEVEIKVYYGGVQGDEPDVLRKIRVGQMHGGMFTGRTLGDINGDVRVIEVPFGFLQDREKGMRILNEMTPYFNNQFEKNGFKNLSFFEIGQVYIVTTKEVSNLDDLKGLKIWSWDGDKVAQALVESMKLVAVPLSLPDVLSSLSTGVIEAAYSTPLGVLALQWQTKVKYLIDYPVTLSIGAFLVDLKQWNAIPDQHKIKVEAIAKKWIAKSSVDINKENLDSLEQLKKSGVKIVPIPAKDLTQVEAYRQDVIKRIVGKVVSQETFTKFNALFNKK